MTLWIFTKNVLQNLFIFQLLILLLNKITPYILEAIFQKEYKKLIKTTDDKIRDKKLQYNINREVAKISALSSAKIDKYEYLTGEEILFSNRNQIIKKPNLQAYSPSQKALGKETEKQVDALESLNLSNDIDELTQTESIFPKNLFGY